MPDRFDLLDLRMMEGLEFYGLRNLTEVARKLGIPSETLRKRLRRRRSQIFLYTNIYHTNLGLKKAVVLAQAIPGYEELLYDSLKANDFWIYVNRCYGMNEGCLAVYTIPRDHTTDFEHFIQCLRKLRTARHVQTFWSTCFQKVHARCNWFDPVEKEWSFPWDKWVEEIPVQGTMLPYTLVDPKDFPIMGDEIDIFILKELEKKPTVGLVKLAKMLGISQQLVSYHYREHILARGLIESFAILDFRFDLKVSDMFLFIFKFDENEKLAMFASSLLDKPFVETLGKVLGENILIAHIYLPKLEFRNLIDALSRLIRLGLLQSYRYVIQDLRKAQRQTISYEYFKGGTWLYDHKKHIENLRNLVKKAVPAIP